MKSSPKVPPEIPMLLGALEAEARTRILAQCVTRRFGGGEQVVREMARDESMYFIVRGRVRVTLFSATGREVSFVDLAQGENFGEIAILDGQPRSANVVALTETDLIVMPPEVFRRMFLQHPAVAMALLRQLSAIIRRLGDRVFEYSTIGVNNRIHAELLRLARENIDLDGIARIPNVPTHAQFASRVSCHREAVSRNFKKLQTNGVMHKKNRKIIIPDIKRLQQMVDQAMQRAPHC